MAAGFDPLYPFVGKDSPAGKKLTAFMEKVGMGEEGRDKGLPPVLEGGIHGSRI